LIDVLASALLLGGFDMRKLLGSVLLLAAVALAPAQAAAQRRAAARPASSPADRPSFGVQLDWGNDPDFGIGGRGVFPLHSLFPKTPLDAIVSFDYFFPGNSVTYWEINGNVAYRFSVPARSSFRPYAGAGLNIAHASATVAGVSASDTKAGLNLLGGTTIKLKGSSLTPFVEGRGEVGGGKTFILTGGIRF
jgi:outer membrane protein with beta-barrel domain